VPVGITFIAIDSFMITENHSSLQFVPDFSFSLFAFLDKLTQPSFAFKKKRAG